MESLMLEYSSVKNSWIVVPRRTNENVGDVNARRMARDERRDTCDVFGLQGRADALEHVINPLRVVLRDSLELADDESRLDERNTDALGPEFAPGALGQSVNAELRRPIHGRVGRDVASDGGTDHDDVPRLGQHGHTLLALARLQHAAARLADEVRSAEQIGADHHFPL